VTPRRAYHHGDLRAALIDTAVELIAEHGARAFSLAEASRRLGVAPSAPYAHFSDRDELLAAVAVRVHELFHAEVLRELKGLRAPERRLAAIARAYVRFAGTRRRLFELLVEAGLDKSDHPELKEAERAIEETFLGSVRALPHVDEAEAAVTTLATAVEATAHGHALLLLDGSFDRDSDPVESAAERAARATLALVESRRLLGRSSVAKRRRRSRA
jgi:AcrR family transcriptional regulator